MVQQPSQEQTLEQAIPALQKMPIADRPLYGINFMNQAGIQFPWQPRSHVDLYWLADSDPVVRMAILNVRNEIFRKGLIIQPKFWGRCDACQEVFEQKPPSALNIRESEFMRTGFSCPECGTGTLWPPVKEQKNVLRDFIRSVNYNGQNLVTMSTQVEDDFQKADDGYIIVRKSYEIGEDGILYATVKEIVRGDPAVILIDSDETGMIGTVHFTCVFHRTVQTSNPHDRCHEPGCPSQQLYGIHYVNSTGGQAGDVIERYIEGEVIHRNKYRPSLLYGYSVLLTCWYHVLANMNMTRYISDYYDKRQTPKGLIAFPGISFESVKRMWEDWQAKLRVNPHYLPIFQLPVGLQGNVPEPKLIEFVKSLSEMEYIQVRDEFRLR
ncbi:MAG: hypothetical protein AAB875_07010, partial [Patescibacteria group bacterium]